VFPGVPPGTYVAFEDQRFPITDFSYADENFVFTNVNVTVVPEPSVNVLFGVGSVVLAICCRWLPWVDTVGTTGEASRQGVG
jgi:hypothetical protein